MRTLAMVIGPVPLLTLLGYLAARDWGLMVGLAVGCFSSLMLLMLFTTIYIFDISVFFGMFTLVCVLPLAVAGLRLVGRANENFMPAATLAQLLAAAGCAALIRTIFHRRPRPTA